MNKFSNTRLEDLFRYEEKDKTAINKKESVMKSSSKGKEKINSNIIVSKNSSQVGAASKYVNIQDRKSNYNWSAEDELVKLKKLNFPSLQTVISGYDSVPSFIHAPKKIENNLSPNDTNTNNITSKKRSINAVHTIQDTQKEEKLKPTKKQMISQQSAAKKSRQQINNLRSKLWRQYYVGNTKAITDVDLWLQSFKQKNQKDRSISLLLCGPSGCGKTFFIENILAEYGYHIVNISLDSINMYNRSNSKTSKDYEKQIKKTKKTTDRYNISNFVATDTPTQFLWIKGLSVDFSENLLWSIFRNYENIIRICCWDNVFNTVNCILQFKNKRDTLKAKTTVQEKDDYLFHSKNTQICFGKKRKKLKNKKSELWLTNNYEQQSAAIKNQNILKENTVAHEIYSVASKITLMKTAIICDGIDIMFEWEKQQTSKDSNKFTSVGNINYLLDLLECIKPLSVPIIFTASSLSSRKLKQSLRIESQLTQKKKQYHQQYNNNNNTNNICYPTNTCQLINVYPPFRDAVEKFIKKIISTSKLTFHPTNSNMNSILHPAIVQIQRLMIKCSELIGNHPILVAKLTSELMNTYNDDMRQLINNLEMSLLKRNDLFVLDQLTDYMGKDKLSNDIYKFTDKLIKRSTIQSTTPVNPKLLGCYTNIIQSDLFIYGAMLFENCITSLSYEKDKIQRYYKHNEEELYANELDLLRRTADLSDIFSLSDVYEHSLKYNTTISTRDTAIRFSALSLDIACNEYLFKSPLNYEFSSSISFREYTKLPQHIQNYNSKLTSIKEYKYQFQNNDVINYWRYLNNIDWIDTINVLCCKYNFLNDNNLISMDAELLACLQEKLFSCVKQKDKKKTTKK